MQKANLFELADKDVQEKLISASNLLAEFITSNINEDYTLSISYTKGEVSVELTDPDGDEIHVDSGRDLSIEDLCCIASFEHDADEAGADAVMD